MLRAIVHKQVVCMIERLNFLTMLLYQDDISAGQLQGAGHIASDVAL